MMLPIHKGPGVSLSAMRLLGLTEQEYYDAQFESGLKYLKHNMSAYLDLRYSRSFWRYYINQWVIAEIEWLNLVEEIINQDSSLMYSASTDPRKKGLNVAIDVAPSAEHIRMLWNGIHAPDKQNYYPSDARLRVMVSELKALPTPVPHE